MVLALVLIQSFHVNLRNIQKTWIFEIWTNCIDGVMVNLALLECGRSSALLECGRSSALLECGRSSALLECGRSWVRDPVGSNHRL